MSEPASAILVNEDEVIANIEKNTIRNLRNMNLEGEARIASLEAENSQLREELRRLKESANRDRDILNIVVEAVGRRGRE